MCGSTLWQSADELRKQPRYGYQHERLQSLAAYLILHADAPQPRERLAFLLWPASSEPQARTNLRQLLHHLKRAFDQRQRFTVSFVYDLGFLAQAMKTWPKRVTGG